MSYPQQGGYGPPQGGPGPHQGYGPPPPGYPPQGGYGAYPPGPPRNNTGMIVGIVVAVVAVIAAVVLVIVLTSGDDDPKNTAGDGGGGNPSATIPGPNMPGDSGDSGEDGGDSGGSAGASPESLADEAVRIIEEQDATAIDDLACGSTEAEELKTALGQLAAIDGISAEVTDVNETGDTASASIEMTAGGENESFTLEMSNADGSGWCASGI